MQNPPKVDFGRALMALALALALWVVIQNEQNPQRTGIVGFAIPVDVENAPPGLVVTTGPPEVQLMVSAPEQNWNQMRQATFRASVDLARGGPGTQEYGVSALSSDPRINILEVIPSRVPVRMETVLKRSVPVKITVTGSVPFGYKYGTPEVSPGSVGVSGPSGAVQRVEHASVEVKLEGVTVNISSSYSPVPVDAQGQEVKGVSTSPAVVSVQVPVSQQVAYKTVGVRAVISGSVGPGYYVQSVSADPSEVTLVGDPKSLAGTDYVDTQPVDVTGATSAVSKLVDLVLPPGVSLARKPGVQVSVKVAPVLLSQTLVLPVTVQGLGPGLQVVGELPTVEFHASGPAAAFESGKVQVIADVTGLAAGTHQVPVKVSVPSGATAGAPTPTAVSITLKAASTPAPGATATPSGRTP